MPGSDTPAADLRPRRWLGGEHRSVAGRRRRPDDVRRPGGRRRVRPDGAGRTGGQRHRPRGERRPGPPHRHLHRARRCRRRAHDGALGGRQRRDCELPADLITRGQPPARFRVCRLPRRGAFGCRGGVEQAAAVGAAVSVDAASVAPLRRSACPASSTGSPAACCSPTRTRRRCSPARRPGRRRARARRTQRRGDREARRPRRGVVRRRAHDRARSRRRNCRSSTAPAPGMRSRPACLAARLAGADVAGDPARRTRACGPGDPPGRWPAAASARGVAQVATGQVQHEPGRVHVQPR